MTETAHDLLQLLSPEERARRAELEEQILVGAHAALLAGRALREIRDTRLYRDGWTTFEAYVDATFRFTRQRAYQLISYAEVAGEAEAQGLTIPTERLARALGVVAPSDYGLVLDVTRAVTGSERPSSAQVQAVADTVRDMAEGAVVEHPKTGEPVPWDSLPAEQRAPALGRAVQRGAKDRTDFQGLDDVKPLDWLDGLRRTAQISLHADKTGWLIEITDTVNGQHWVTKSPVKALWDAIRAARAMVEGEARTEGENA